MIEALRSVFDGDDAAAVWESEIERFTEILVEELVELGNVNKKQ